MNTNIGFSSSMFPLLLALLPAILLCWTGQVEAGFIDEGREPLLRKDGLPVLRILPRRALSAEARMRRFRCLQGLQRRRETIRLECAKASTKGLPKAVLPMEALTGNGDIVRMSDAWTSNRNPLVEAVRQAPNVTKTTTLRIIGNGVDVTTPLPSPSPARAFAPSKIQQIEEASTTRSLTRLTSTFSPEKRAHPKPLLSTLPIRKLRPWARRSRPRNDVNWEEVEGEQVDEPDVAASMEQQRSEWPRSGKIGIFKTAPKTTPNPAESTTAMSSPQSAITIAPKPDSLVPASSTPMAQSVPQKVTATPPNVLPTPPVVDPLQMTLSNCRKMDNCMCRRVVRILTGLWRRAQFIRKF